MLTRQWEAKTKTKTTPEQNKVLVLEAFDTLFNKRDYAAAERHGGSGSQVCQIASKRDPLSRPIPTLGA